MAKNLLDDALLRLWKISGRQTSLDDSATEIETILRTVLPLKRMIIRVLDDKLKHLSGPAEIAQPETTTHRIRSLDGAEAEQWRKWCSSQRVQRRTKRLTGVLALLFPNGWPGDLLAIPIHAEGLDAAVVFAGTEGSSFSDEEVEIALRLADPVKAAVANHYRIHELASLREAAEADKGALLQRLGRTGLGDMIIGESTGLQKVMERVRLVASSDAPVIVLGETGSGKELIARALHNQGRRSRGPFIRVNCGAIPPELIDAQLFGHEKGAFTGAEQSRQGWFERADGGTLFLDEIGELPLEAQVRFLRVLQDGFVERVGSDKPIQVDVRVVAATHRDLAAMVAGGKFREDLWYRVAVFPILLPPLRERRDDIPELAAHFAERAANRFGLHPVMPTAKDVELLQKYHWPGNIRELGSVMDRAAILGDGKSLEVATALGLGTQPPEPSVTSPPASEPGGIPTGAPPRLNTPVKRAENLDDLSIDNAMRRHIKLVLAQTRGRIQGSGGAAELLAINPHTLRARMRKLQIRWQDFRRRE